MRCFLAKWAVRGRKQADNCKWIGAVLGIIRSMKLLQKIELLLFSISYERFRLLRRSGGFPAFAPQSRRIRSCWRGVSGRPSPWSCPTADTRRNLTRFLAIRPRPTAVSASVNARWRRFAGRSGGRRGTEAAPSGRAGRGDNKRTTARKCH